MSEYAQILSEELIRFFNSSELGQKDIDIEEQGNDSFTTASYLDQELQEILNFIKPLAAEVPDLSNNQEVNANSIINPLKRSLKVIEEIKSELRFLDDDRNNE